MTEAMNRLKCHPLPTFYYTKFGVSGDTSEETEHDISDHVQPAPMPEIVPPEARPIALPVQLIRDVCERLTASSPKPPEHINENYSPKERAARNQVNSIMRRYLGYPTHGFADVWLPVSDEYGFQKTMTVAVPICVTLDETYDCIIETAPGSQEYLAFPFDVEAEPVVSRLSA